MQSEYDDNKVDPHHGDQGQQEEAENLDLPDDLNLDRDEKGEETAREGKQSCLKPDILVQDLKNGKLNHHSIYYGCCHSH